MTLHEQKKEIVAMRMDLEKKLLETIEHTSIVQAELVQALRAIGQGIETPEDTLTWEQLMNTAAEVKGQVYHLRQLLENGRKASRLVRAAAERTAEQ